MRVRNVQMQREAARNFLHPQVPPLLPTKHQLPALHVRGRGSSHRRSDLPGVRSTDTGRRKVSSLELFKDVVP